MCVCVCVCVCACVCAASVFLQEAVECGADPESGEEVEEEEGSGESEIGEGESQEHCSSHYSEKVEGVHGGQEEVRGHMCPPQSQDSPVSG